MEKKMYEDRGREWSDADTSQGKLGEARKAFSPGVFGGPGPASTWVSDLWPPEL